MSRPTSPCAVSPASSPNFLLSKKRRYLGKGGSLSITIPAGLPLSSIDELRSITSTATDLPSSFWGALTLVDSSEEGFTFPTPATTLATENVYGQAQEDQGYDSDNSARTYVGESSPTKAVDDLKHALLTAFGSEANDINDTIILSHVDLLYKYNSMDDMHGGPTDVITACMVEEGDAASFCFFPVGDIQLIHLISAWQHIVHACSYTLSAIDPIILCRTIARFSVSALYPVLLAFSVFRALHRYRLIRYIFWGTLIWRNSAAILLNLTALLINACILYTRIPGSMAVLDFFLWVFCLIMD
ncbi:hypothetical protein BOTBODRAFT_173032 [Botryobasidium botryosum FD-172 SS1]|uniref:Uncharacterized protein n=1 Tax=Botryobasidium botryosum (strain FD-172 SS1) TaxID=930990 RepID=A0A067MP76_BOTB1|nr:hypothetical protein BOTBODRAFT_173032 [Botryobasidium botryosum FD-172 SS1]